MTGAETIQHLASRAIAASLAAVGVNTGCSEPRFEMREVELGIHEIVVNPCEAVESFVFMDNRSVAVICERPDGASPLADWLHFVDLDTGAVFTPDTSDLIPPIQGGGAFEIRGERVLLVLAQATPWGRYGPHPDQALFAFRPGSEEPLRFDIDMAEHSTFVGFTVNSEAGCAVARRLSGYANPRFMTSNDYSQDPAWGLQVLDLGAWLGNGERAAVDAEEQSPRSWLYPLDRPERRVSGPRDGVNPSTSVSCLLSDERHVTLIAKVADTSDMGPFPNYAMHAITQTTADEWRSLDLYSPASRAGWIIPSAVARAVAIGSSARFADLRDDELQIFSTQTLNQPRTLAPPEAMLHWEYYDPGMDAGLLVPFRGTDAFEPGPLRIVDCRGDCVSSETQMLVRGPLAVLSHGFIEGRTVIEIRSQEAALDNTSLERQLFLIDLGQARERN